MASSRSRDWVLGSILFVVTLLAYQSAWNGKPIWDDDAHMTSPRLRSMDGLASIWLQPGATQQYYPLVYTVFWLEYQLWGESPLGHHLLNIFLHFFSALLLVRILRRLEIPGAWLAAAVFALHPVHVESVAWITELKNVLSGTFYLGAALIYLKFDQERVRTAYAAAFGLFVLGLMSKTVIATFPAAMLVICWWKRGRLSWKEDVAPLSAFFLAGVAYGLYTAWIEFEVLGAHGRDFALLPIDRILIAGRVSWFYLAKLFWPGNLMFIYPRWEVSHAVLWQYLFPTAVLALLWAVWALRHRWRGPLAASLYFGGTLFPVLGFLNVYPFRFSFVADHFQYLASLGIIVLASATIAQWLGARKLWQKTTGGIACLVVLAILSGLTWRQGMLYADVETLWRTTIQKNPDAWLAYNNLGVVFYQKKEVEAARTHYQKALELHPDFAMARTNLGMVFLTTGQTQEAIAQFRQALELDAAYAEAHNKLCFAFLQTGQIDEATLECQRAVKINPYLDEAHNNLANASLYGGRIREAITHYNQALELNPNVAETHYNLGNALGQIEKIDEAIVHYQKALEINPLYMKAQANLAWALATAPNPWLRNGPEAVALAERANHISGGRDPTVLVALAAAYAEARRFGDAAGTAQRAIALAQSAGSDSLVNEIQEQLKLYQAGRALTTRMR